MGASGGAYVIYWYSIVKRIDRIDASTVQLSVPCLAILGGALFIGVSCRATSDFINRDLILLGILLIYAGKNSVEENK